MGELGQRFPLFQETQQHFIVFRNTLEAGGELCAFRKVSKKGEGVAWITAGKVLIFASQTRSEEGMLYLKKGERCPVVGQSSSSYRILVERYGHEVELELPKGQSGIAFHAADQASARPVLPAALKKTKSVEKKSTTRRSTSVKPRRVRKKPLPAHSKPTITTVMAGPDTSSSNAVSVPVFAVDEIPVSVVHLGSTDTHTFQSSADDSLRDAEAVVIDPTPIDPVVFDDATSDEEVDHVVPVELSEEPAFLPVAIEESESVEVSPEVEKVEVVPPPEMIADEEKGSITEGPVEEKENESETRAMVETVPQQQGAVSFLEQNSVSFYILLVFVVFEGALIVRLQKRTSILMTAAEEFRNYASLNQTGAKKYFQDLQEEQDDFSGSLASLSIFDLVEFLRSAGDTGMLYLKNAEGQTNGGMLFEKGEAIHAFNGELVGEEAFLHLLAEEHVGFSFDRMDKAKTKRTINRGTISLLLVAARAADEGLISIVEKKVAIKRKSPKKTPASPKKPKAKPKTAAKTAAKSSKKVTGPKTKRKKKTDSVPAESKKISEKRTEVQPPDEATNAPDAGLIQE